MPSMERFRAFPLVGSNSLKVWNLTSFLLTASPISSEAEATRKGQLCTEASEGKKEQGVKMAKVIATICMPPCRSGRLEWFKIIRVTRNITYLRFLGHCGHGRTSDHVAAEFLGDPK